MYDDGGEVANTILQQLGGAGRLRAMTGAYNFYDLGDGLSFKIKNARANYIKIKLTSMDLYDVEVGRIRGTTYKVVQKAEGLYFDQLRPFIEKATGMYLSLRKGGQIEKAIKQKLSKSFDLPLQMAVYVPSTKDKNVVVSKQEMDERVLEVKSYLAELFGGFNSVKVEGGFESSDKGLIEEDAVRIVAFASQDGFESKFEKLISKIKIWCKEWSQESIGLEFENDLFYIESGSQYSNGGMIQHKTEDGETLKYKIDKDEMSLEVDFPTMEYLSENGIVMKREARKLRDTYIFWYDQINESSKEELEETLKVELPISDDYDDDDYEDYARGGEVYKLGDTYSDDFDYKGMLKMGLKAQTSWGSKKLRKLFDSYEDVNYHKASTNLWNAIQSIQKSEEVQTEEAKNAYILAADNYIERFHDDVIEEMLSQMEDVKEDFKVEAKLLEEDFDEIKDSSYFKNQRLFLYDNTNSDEFKISIWGSQTFYDPSNQQYKVKSMGKYSSTNEVIEALNKIPNRNYSYEVLKSIIEFNEDISKLESWDDATAIEEIVFNLIPTRKKNKEISDVGIMEKGGQVDLFEQMESLPDEVQSVLGKYSDGESYLNLENLLNELKPLGYTFEYGLDAVPYGLTKMDDGGMMADGGMVSLSKHYKTLAKKDDLVGLKVYDENNDEYVYIKSVDGGIWAGKNKNDELGHYYDMSDLMVKKYADGGTMAKGGKVKKRVRFVDKVESIADRLEGTKVPKTLKKDYGGKYNREESEEAARRIAGAQLRDRKM
jgi:hypothetical protein